VAGGIGVAANLSTIVLMPWKWRVWRPDLIGPGGPAAGGGTEDAGGETRAGGNPDRVGRRGLTDRPRPFTAGVTPGARLNVIHS
jgi:hypothetical protein